jgi:hypothetical protein
LLLLLALPRLMHFGVSRLARILCATGRTDDLEFKSIAIRQYLPGAVSPRGNEPKTASVAGGGMKRCTVGMLRRIHSLE